jgi:16S rRNA (uracil1498-N3)-methyltransferase
MQRYFITLDNMLEDKAIIRGDDAHHLMRVMRAEPGDQVIVSNGLNRECLAEVVELYKENVLVKLLEERPMTGEPSTAVWIAQSLPKGDKLETVIQKGTEIGASAFLPFVSSRTIVQYDAKKEAKRLERWRKIAKEAAEQAHRSIVPDVRDTVSWKQLMNAAKEASMTLFCYEKENTRLLREVLQRADAESLEGPVMIVIGPEGGFTEEEAVEAERLGWIPVGLGRRILRTETAGLVAAACIMYELGEMGGK